jgi:hypothetical protein
LDRERPGRGRSRLDGEGCLPGDSEISGSETDEPTALREGEEDPLWLLLEVPGEEASGAPLLRARRILCAPNRPERR